MLSDFSTPLRIWKYRSINMQFFHAVRKNAVLIMQLTWDLRVTWCERYAHAKWHSATKLLYIIMFLYKS